MACLAFIAAAGAIGFALYGILAFQVRVPPHHIGWDGETIYHPGTYWTPNKMNIVDLRERIQSFGEDELGVISLVETSLDESGWENTTGAEATGSTYGKASFQAVTSKAPKNYKNKCVIVWKPNTKDLERFLAVNVAGKISEMLRTIPTLDLKRYESFLGIEIVFVEDSKTGKEQAYGSVELGDGVEIPY